jgi:tetratricopeptide (TPR) repeat protein
LRKTLDLDPNFPDAYYWLAITQRASGKHEEAIAHIQRGLNLSGGDVRMRCLLAACKARAGHKEEAFAQLQELSRLAEERYVSPVLLANVYLSLGDFDAMFDLLENGFQERDPLLLQLLRAPALDVVRAHPRFQDLQRRLGIAP